MWGQRARARTKRARRRWVNQINLFVLIAERGKDGLEFSSDKPINRVITIFIATMEFSKILRWRTGGICGWRHSNRRRSIRRFSGDLQPKHVHMVWRLLQPSKIWTSIGGHMIRLLKPDFHFPSGYGHLPFINRRPVVLYGARSCTVPGPLGMQGLRIHGTLLPFEVPPHCTQKRVSSHLLSWRVRCMLCQGCPAETLIALMSL